MEPTLEHCHGVLQDFAGARIMELEAQRDELLSAIKRCLNFIENTESELGVKLESGDTARAVISKAEGKK
jgi:hypothetical protein